MIHAFNYCMFQVKEVGLQLFFAKRILEKTMFSCFWTFQISICDITPQLLHGGERFDENGLGLSSYPVLKKTMAPQKKHMEDIFSCGGIPTNGHLGYKRLDDPPNLI